MIHEMIEGDQIVSLSGLYKEWFRLCIVCNS